jgi:insulysin
MPTRTKTSYYFEIIAGGDTTRGDVPALYGALDRFASIFINPPFLPSAVDREVQAIDSEFRDLALSDGTRVWQVERSMSNPSCPWSYFGDGNLDTLKKRPEARGLNVRDTALEFHARCKSRPPRESLGDGGASTTG